MHILVLKSSPVQRLHWGRDLKQTHKKERRIKKSVSPLPRASSRSLLLCWVWEQFFVFCVPWTPAVWKEPTAGAWLNSDSDFCAKGSHSVEPVPELKAHSEFLLNCWFFFIFLFFIWHRLYDWIMLQGWALKTFDFIPKYTTIFTKENAWYFCISLCSKTKWTA